MYAAHVTGVLPVSKSVSMEGIMSKSLKLPSSRLLNIVPIAADMSLIAAGPAAADPQETKVTEHATTDAVTDIGAKGDGVGDLLTFANEVFDVDDKNKIGTDQGICFRTVPGQPWDAQPGKGQVNRRGAVQPH